MLVIFVSKIICSVMNLTIYWAFRLDFLPVRKESNVPSISLVDEYAFKVWAPLYII